MKQMKFIVSALLTLALTACVGGEIQMENPCEEGYVLTGGWTGEWSTGDAECVPDGDMNPELDMNSGGNNHANHNQNNNPDMGSNNQNPNNTNPGNNGNPNNQNPNNSNPNNQNPGDMGPDMTGDMGSDMDTDMGGCEPGVPCCEGESCPCTGTCCGNDCPPVCEGTQVQKHRIVGILLQLTNPDVPLYKAKKLVKNSLEWVSNSRPCNQVKVLVVRDDNHNHEFHTEPHTLKLWMLTMGYDVSFLDEPGHGLQDAHVQGFDVVWFSNPGYPVDDQRSLDVLRRFAQAGGGVILQGDDMSRNGTEPFLNLEHKRNGTRTCDVPTDNNVGESYKVTFENQSHKVISHLQGKTFYYANDIDHSQPMGLGEKILAWAQLDPRLGCNCTLVTPVVVAREVDAYCEEFPPVCDEACDHTDHPSNCPHHHRCPHEKPECEDDDGHTRRGHGYGHCKNADNPGHDDHDDD